MGVRPVDGTIALACLLRDPYRYFAEVVAVARNIPPIPREVYADGDPASVVMLVEQYPHFDTPTVTVMRYDAPFLRAAVAGRLAGIERFSLGSPDRRVLEAPEIRETFEVGQVSGRRSFVCTSLDSVPALETDGKPLAAADREAFVAYPSPAGEHGPSAEELFRWLVVEGRGEILAVWEGDTIAGYLSCTPEYEHIWDLEFIHVRPERRGQRIGAQLAVAYARRRLSAGQVPYWSSAANEASERTALRAGFRRCRQLRNAMLSRK